MQMIKQQVIYLLFNHLHNILDSVSYISSGLNIRSVIFAPLNNFSANL